jgi:hypothetical protein
MIDIKVEVCACFARCCNTNCQRSSEYHYTILENSHWIKQGTVCARIQIENRVEYYCRDCIDEIYNLIKSKLDSKLWIFS